MMNRWDDNWQNDFISGHQIFFYGSKISSGEQLKIGFSGHDLFFEKEKKNEKKNGKVGGIKLINAWICNSCIMKEKVNYK